MDKLIDRPATPEGPREVDIGFLQAQPGLADENSALTPQLFQAFEDAGSKALVITGYGTGTTPAALNPYIAKSVEKVVPVFVLANNPGDDQGPQRITYGAHQAAVDAGATILRDVNVNRIQEVAHKVQDAIEEGKTGPDLTQAVVDMYGTPAREDPN